MRTRPERLPRSVFSWSRSPGGSSCDFERLHGEIVWCERLLPDCTSMMSRGRSGAISVKRTRHAVPAALISDIVATIATVAVFVDVLRDVAANFVIPSGRERLSSVTPNARGLMLEKTIEDHGREVQRRLYAHQDYFGNIIPSSWFLIVVSVGAFMFYRPELARLMKAVHRFITSFGEPSTGADVVMAIVLAVITFNVVYVIGQLLNGVAAVVLDRTIVKKLLRYPFTLYELKCQNTDESRSDIDLFRQSVLEASYGVFCVNLVPIVFFELALVAFGRENPHTGSWVQTHPAATTLLTALMVTWHLGIPSLRKAREICEADSAPKDTHLDLFFSHIALLIIGTATVSIAIVGAGLTSIVLILPLTNIVLAVMDRRLLNKRTAEEVDPAQRRVFIYARRTFVNPSYFAAKLVGYGTAPDAGLLRKALAEAKYDSRANDFYWMCQLRLENEAPRSYDSAYHGMAMYTMNRNLCNATALAAVVSVAAFYVRWPEGFRHSTLLWVGILCLFTYMFFIRYLYLFSGLYSKYVVRAAAYLADRQTLHLIAKPGDA